MRPSRKKGNYVDTYDVLSELLGSNLDDEVFEE